MFWQSPNLRSNMLPFIFALVLTWLMIIFSLWWTGRYQNGNPKISNRFLYSMLGLLVLEGICGYYLQSFIDGFEFGTGLANPVFFPVILSFFVVMSAISHESDADPLLGYVVAVAGAILLLPVYLQEPIMTDLTVLAFPVVAYALAKPLRKVGIISGLLVR
ncbi:hypothetical protein ACFQJC_13820 [Haloferax namakaokahaiae]|uniref:Uncharacterized protein n=1 Tax=Haloferax namakaokahaiae TaxID=1748331 RepID=A0ABD5ZI36_9EURY